MNTVASTLVSMQEIDLACLNSEEGAYTQAVKAKASCNVLAARRSHINAALASFKLWHGVKPVLRAGIWVIPQP